MRLTVAVAIGVLGGIGIIPLPAAHGLTFAVRNTEDSGAGSLRQAVLDANAAAGPDEIKFAPALEGQAIVLTGGPLEVRDSLSIAGPGPDRLLIRSDDPTPISSPSVETASPSIWRASLSRVVRTASRSTPAPTATPSRSRRSG
jgi:hypothetical protein